MLRAAHCWVVQRDQTQGFTVSQLWSCAIDRVSKLDKISTALILCLRTVGWLWLWFCDGRTAATAGWHRPGFRASLSAALMHLAAAPTGVQRAGELQHLLPGTVRQAGARHRGLYQQPKFTRRDRGGETRHFERLPLPGQLRSSQQQHPQQPNPQLPHPQQVPPLPAPASSSSPAAAQRKSTSSRRNAWGNMSYADLITKAIESSPEKRLTLSQIYEWMVKSVPYFKDKGDSNSSAGWKVMALQGQAQVSLKVALEVILL